MGRNKIPDHLKAQYQTINLKVKDTLFKSWVARKRKMKLSGPKLLKLLLDK